MRELDESKATTAAYREIKDRILHLRYPVGEKLSETRLAAELDLGRSPIRTALTRLKNEGWVAVSPQSGTFVRALTDKEIRELTDLRIVLEMHVTSIAARTIGDEELQMLRDAFDAFSPDSMESSLEEFLDLDSMLHAAIYRAADNNLIMNILRDLRDKVEWIRRANSVSITRFQDSFQELVDILDALEARAPERAAACMGNHIRNAASFCRSTERGERLP